MIEIAILFLGISAGVLSGLFGIGGGIIMVPCLIAFFGMEMLNANATSLAAMLLPVGIFGVLTYYKAGFIQVKSALLISLGLFLGSFIGAELAIHVRKDVLSALYAIFLIYIAVSFLDIPSLFRKKSNSLSSPEVNLKHDFLLGFVFLGLFAGVFAGLFGKGGGIVIVPLLVSLFRYDNKTATATSLAALQLPVGLPSVVVYAKEGFMNWTFAVLMAFGLVIGVYFGSKLAIKLPSKQFKRYYAIFLVVVALYMVLKH